MTACDSRPPSRLRNRAPKRDSGSMTRRIGRLRSEASPVTKAVNGWVARMPSSSRAEVPELPRSSTSSGSPRPPTPTPSTCQRPSPVRSMPAPIARNAAAVASTSSPSSRPVISVRPTASAPNSSARRDTDVSPGTPTLPESGPLGRPAAPVEKELEPVGAGDIDPDLEAEETETVEGEEEEGVPLEEAEEEEEELIEDASELGEGEDDMAEVIDNVEEEEP